MSADALLIAAPLRIEALLIGSAVRRAQVRRTGMGPERSRAAARELNAHPGAVAAVVAMGFCGALDAALVPGDVVVCERVLCYGSERGGREPERGERWGPQREEGWGEAVTLCAGADALALALASRGLRVRRGAIVSVARLARGERRAQLRERGAIAADMESAWLAGGLQLPFAAVRVVVDTPARELTRPLATLRGGARAALVLRRAARAVDELVREHGVHTVFGTDADGA
jgi:nucleoside phosphorylase